jgi:hypothetical protein
MIRIWPQYGHFSPLEYTRGEDMPLKSNGGGQNVHGVRGILKHTESSANMLKKQGAEIGNEKNENYQGTACLVACRPADVNTM